MTAASRTSARPPIAIILLALFLSIQPTSASSQAVYAHFIYLPLIRNGDPQLILHPSGDAEIREDEPAANFADGLTLQVGNGTAAHDARRALIRFSIGTLPPSAQILDAKLSIYYYSWMDIPYSLHSVSFHWVNEPWQANTVTWDNQPSAAEESGTIMLPADMDHWGYYSIEVTEIVQTWFLAPFTNNGILIRTEENASVRFFRSFWSQEGEHPPLLVITYQVVP